MSRILSPMSYNSYHTDLKIAVSLGLAPEKLMLCIPRSTRHRFIKYDFSSTIGLDQSELPERISIAKEFISNKKAINLFKAALYLRDIKIRVLNRNKQKSLSSKQLICGAINKTKDILGLSRAVKVFSITPKTYHNWMSTISHKCLDSAFYKCVKTWPNQLTGKEVQVMKHMLTDGKYNGWSVSSIAAYALKNGLLSACTSTWYKYSRYLGIIRKKTLSRRKNHKTGIRAHMPHRIWHMDVTVFKTADNIKSYIPILMDNYSRYILGYKVSLSLKAENTFLLLKDAYDKYIIPKDRNEITLITDGGSENINNTVLEFTGSSDNAIKQLRALVDIDFSNSMVEAYNKILKYRFLYIKAIPNFDALQKYLPKAIDEYNKIQPHHAHKLQTPKEALEGFEYPNGFMKERIKKAQKLRIAEHKNSSCKVCG